MSVKKFMHPRNIYRKPPNFKELALAYPEFRKFAQQDLSGRVTISFKDPGALRVLSKCLLHRDFNLTVDIPSNRLAPTIALRLNYLLWIEDILEENSLRNVEVTGIDIGTGASCVYPLIAASRFKWHMLATEIDEDSYQIALKNVEVNNLQNMITIKKVSGDTVLASAVDRDHCYEFCMCNPPFFGSEIELDPTKMSRSQSRPPPHNAPTGSVSELITPGGEIGFIKRMIDDSMELKNLIRVYTVMMGRRNSVKVVEGFLEEAKVCSIGTTEFYQGHTSRWAIAWTYDPHITLRKIQIKYSTKKKSNTPFTLTVQQKVDCVVSRIKEFLSELQVEIKTQENKSDFCAMELIAEKNTWTKQRRSEREHIQNESQKDNNSGTYTQGLPVLIGGMRKGGSTTEHTAEELIHNRQSKSAGEQNKSPQLKRPVEDDCDYDLLKRHKTETAGPSVDFKVEPILVASLVVRPLESNTCVIELSWLGGVGGKNLGHQLLQYIKNRLGVH